MAYKVLNLLSDGGVGGIENLCKCISDIRTEEIVSVVCLRKVQFMRK